VKDSVRNDTEAIVVEDLHKAYRDVRAVDGVSLAINRGEFVGLLGPNGAGKTTLIELVEGLRRADSGRVSVLGQATYPRNLALLPRIGVQTQKSAFFTRLTAREHLATMAALYGLSPAAADTALDRVGLAGSADVRVTRLSGGQRQRLAIASALVHDPEIIFMDEPTAALDPEARRDLWKLLRALKAAGRTILYTTHHLDEAEALCDRVAILAGGQIVALGSPHELISRAGQGVQLVVPAGRLSLEQARSLDGVEGVTVEGGQLVLQTAASGRTLASIGAVAGLDGVQTRTTTLEDVYLDLIGANR
jgi:ABC-2 type transport system ATP-binding protein